MATAVGSRKSEAVSSKAPSPHPHRLPLTAYCLLLFSGCSGPAGLLNLVPTRTFENRQSQEMRDWIAGQITQNTEAITNEVWPWIVGLVLIFGLSKLADGMALWIQGARQAKHLSGHQAKLEHVAKMIENGGPPGAPPAK